MKYKATLQELFTAINELDGPATLALLNIDETLLELPETTLSYIARCDHWKRLLDIVASIPHLIEQSSTDYTPLVGFLGHFSSGKSTLINAVMDIDRNEYPAYRRESGRNPTDRRITLTTHFDNYRRTRGEFVSSVDKVDVVQGPRLPLLEKMTLVDTPGLGDDPAEMATIIRFLHLVHVLVLTVDGRRPFADTEKDFTLLDVALNRLAGVPRVFAITSAVDFLTDRKGDFDTDWNPADADEFWQETLGRLLADPRFEEHGTALMETPHQFVDSIEGFRIKNLVDAIVPVVVDEGQRARTDVARAEYVINSAVDSLEYLEGYVAERSRHLAELRTDAERRSETTQTAIENLVADLGRRLSGTLEFLQGHGPSAADIVVPLDQIVTIQTVTQGIDISATESTIADALKEIIDARHSQVGRRSIENYRKRRKGLQEAYRSEALSDADIAGAVEKTEILRQLRRCARDALNTAVAKHQATRTLGLEILDRRSERGRVMSAARDIQLDFGGFQEIHDDTVKALIAYITQPSSLDLLREHGFVGFDKSGQRIAEPDSIDMNEREDYRRIVDEIEKCKVELKKIYDQATDDLKKSELDGAPPNDDDAGDVLATNIVDESALKPIVEQISARACVGVAELDQTVDEQVRELIEEIVEAKQVTVTRVRDIWKARGRIALRLVVVILLFGAVGLVFGRFVPGVWTGVWSSLPEWMIRGAVSSTITSLALSIGFFILIGFTNANLRVAFRSTTLVRVKLASLQRTHKRRIRRTCEEELAKAKAKAAASVNSTENGLLSAVVRWLENSCEAYTESAGELREIRQRVNERSQLVNGLVNKISTFQNDLPGQLRERSEEIRSAAVSTHMSTIRQAAQDVEHLRKTIAGIAEKARSATVS